MVDAVVGDARAPRYLKSARIIDGRSAWAFAGGVLVEGERIGAVYREEAEGPLPLGTRVVDLGGRTLMPGLIDCHTHLIYSGYRDLAAFDADSLELATIKAARNAGVLLAHGFTSVRDMGCRGNVAVAVRDAVAQGLIPGPRVRASGQVISPTGGLGDPHPAWMHSDSPFGLVADGVDEVVRAVRRQVKLGVDNVKIGASGGEIAPFHRSYQPSFSLRELQATVEVASSFGRTVGAHAQATQAIKDALRAGVTTVEHGTYMDDECLELFLETGTFYVPTLCTVFSFIERGEATGAPRRAIDECRANQGPWVASVRRAREAGVRIAVGSDVGNRYLQGSNARELQLLVRHGGLSAMEAIQAATVTAAAAIGVADQVGTLEPGKLADLLILEDNPLDTVAVLQDVNKIAVVMQGGRVVARRGRVTADE